MIRRTGGLRTCSLFSGQRSLQSAPFRHPANRLLKHRSARLGRRDTLADPGTGITLLGGNRKRDLRFPRPRGTVPRRPERPGDTEASARPGGREAPAVGGAGAGRGALAPPGGTRGNDALWQRRWPLPWQRRWRFHPRGRGGHWPGGLCAPRRDKVQRSAGTGSMTPARNRKARAGRPVSRFPFSHPCGRRLFSAPLKAKAGGQAAEAAFNAVPGILCQKAVQRGPDLDRPVDQRV